MLEKVKEVIATPETKPFYLTSEFSLLVVAAANTVVISNPTDAKTLISDALVAIYGVIRGISKAGTPYEESTGEAAAELPTQTGDIPLSLPAGGSGLKGVQPAPAAATQSAALPDTLGQARELLSEHPELVQQLKQEGVIT